MQKVCRIIPKSNVGIILSVLCDEKNVGISVRDLLAHSTGQNLEWYSLNVKADI